MKEEDSIDINHYDYYNTYTTYTADSNIVGQTWYDSNTNSLNANLGSGIGQITLNTSLSPNFTNISPITFANVNAGNTFVDSKLTINHNGQRIDVGEAITMLMDRLCIIEPSLHLHEKYPALKEAYDAYKAIEAMCKAGDTDE